MSNPAQYRTVKSCYDHGTTNIPLPTFANRSTRTDTDKWKTKYEETDQKRKRLLIQNEKTSRNFNELERKFKQLKLQNIVCEGELSDKSEKLKDLRTVSQNLYKEYDTLKTQYDLETTAMHRALSEAGQWYQQNRELKRQSLLLTSGNRAVSDVVDNNEGDHTDLEGLREAIRELSASNAKLQTELNEAKLSEFEATEQVVNLTQENEVLQHRCTTFESEILDLRNNNEQLVRVSKLISNELAELKESAQKHRENAVSLRHEADDAKRERNVLAHQSSLLLQNYTLDNDKIMLLQEIEQLKRSLEETTNKYERDIVELQDKLEERENDPQLEIVEERLKLAEAELKHALERAENLEKQTALLTAPPPPPPPPPPPAFPLVDTFVPIAKPQIRIPNKITIFKDPKITTVDTSNEQQSVCESIVNEIKGGKFTLKSRNKPDKKKREEPEAVSEMLKILGTLRRSKTNGST